MNQKNSEFFLGFFWFELISNEETVAKTCSSHLNLFECIRSGHSLQRSPEADFLVKSDSLEERERESVQHTVNTLSNRLTV